MATVIDTCASLTAEECGAYVQGTCAASPSSCGIYSQLYDAEMFGDLLSLTVTVVLLAVAFRVGKRLLAPGL